MTGDAVDIQRGISAPFADREWLPKTLWAALWTGVVVTAPAVTGYTLDYVRSVAYGQETPLPEWNRGFGRWWIRGFLLGIAGFIYMLPAIILLIVSIVPLVVVAASSGAQEFGRTAALLGSGGVCLAGAAAIAYFIAVSLFFYGAYVNFALAEDFGALFRVGEIFARIKSDSSAYLTAWGVSLGVSFVTGVAASFAGSVLGATGVLVPLAGFIGGAFGFIGGLISAHLFGQYAARAYGLPGVVRAYMPPAGYTAAGYPAAPQAPAPGAPYPASSAHSEPDSPMPSYSPEQTAPPSSPESDPPAENGGA
jgi:hypothetical protein